MHKRYHVLLVEDNPGDAELVRGRLADTPRTPFQVTLVNNASDAVQRLASDNIDAVILDLNLGDSYGLATLERIREAGKDLPIIVTSSGLDPRLRSDIERLGAADALSKREIDSRLFSRSVLYAIEQYRAVLDQQKFQDLFELNPDAVLVVTAGGAVRYVNQAAVQLFGRTREDLLRETLGFSTRDAEPTEILVAHPSGARCGEMRVVPVEWEGQAAYLASIRDVTERKSTEALRARAAELEQLNHRLQAASRLKSQFVANMSHELRTPLNAIIGFSELLVDGVVDSSSAKYKPFVNHIWTSGKHLLRLIDDVLELAKVEAGKIDFHPEPFDLHETIREVLATMRRIAEEKRVTVELDLDANVRRVEIDRGRFQQVLYNFLSNAMKFTEGGHITVRAREAYPGAFRVEVQDTGVGIAAEDLEKLFVEFQQLEAGSDKKYHGTGLGLALTKRIVEAQGGSVGVQSTLGKGSVFYVVLPRVPSHHGGCS